ncbi:MAG: HNH endonuclease [Anaerolineales bacterium]|nr:HNH endonuclease [Anaerolineales bacterium]
MTKDLAIRLAAFKWLAEQTQIHGDVLPLELLQQGFEFEGHRIPLVNPQGIFKPKVMDLPLSIKTIPGSPYDDGFDDKGLLTYRYRGTDPSHRDNIGLREVLRLRLPLVYFFRTIPSKYLATWPVYIVGDDPSSLTFRVQVDDLDTVEIGAKPKADRVAEQKRGYITAAVRQRIHQRSFRDRVLQAYHDQCAFCRLKHRELLDASHIIPDTEEISRPTVDNGMALCKLHHAAFDNFILGVSPDFIIEVREDILEEVDGPILKHGLQELHGSKIILPSRKIDWPDRDALAWRFERYQAAGN